jgi:hypothetical protein
MAMELTQDPSCGASGLQEHGHEERGYEEPHAREEHEASEQLESGSLRAADRDHRGGTVVAALAVVLMQVAWAALLGYLMYSAWVGLPF